MRLIDADYLKTWFGEKDLYSYDYIIDTINDAPTIEPERKKGGWIFATNFPDGKSCYVCREFICPDCENWNDEFHDCEMDESYCIDKMDEFFKTHELYQERIWKCREKGEK